MRTWSASRSASENTATDAMPCSRHARITRTAISPRFATRTFVSAPRPAIRLPRVELEAGEEVGDLGRGGFRRVGAVHRVGLDGRREILADRARGGLGRVGGAHEIAPARDPVVALEHHQETRPLCHERAQAVVERPLPVNVVEAARLHERHVNQLGREDREARVLDAREDLADDSPGHRVGLDDGEGALRAHRPITLAIVAPMSAGLLTRVAPASSSACIFSAAVPLPPAMIAPACPIRRPGGAVWPQMKATTGFFTRALMNAAASSSAVPPISPIIMIERVSGSPPSPTQVDCPIPRPVSWPTTSYVRVPLRETTPTGPALWMCPGMIPILAWSGVMTPGQFGPIRRLLVPTR